MRERDWRINQVRPATRLPIRPQPALHLLALVRAEFPENRCLANGCILQLGTAAATTRILTAVLYEYSGTVAEYDM